jgi:ribosomal protein S18 acetylase RimI-like enzyme
MPAGDLARADAFAKRQLERTSTDIVPFEGGTAFLDRDFPRRYDSNLLWIEEPGQERVDRWLAEADRILGGRGYRHRKVVVPDPDAQRRLEVGFAEHGYGIDRVVLMVHHEEPQREYDLTAVEEVSFGDVRPLIETIARRQPWATDDGVVRELADYPGKYARATGCRFFAVRIAGELVGSCELLVDGAEAAVDSVDTLQEHRNRGHASAFVLAAVRAAREDGASWVHLWADVEDWPQHWYRRLGFRPAAEVADFLRWPEDEGPKVQGASSGAKSPDRA